VDPLVVARQLGERVDLLLRDLDPVGRPDRLADQLAQPVDPLDLHRGHRRAA
jgi:hypothetical protein